MLLTDGGEEVMSDDLWKGGGWEAGYEQNMGWTQAFSVVFGIILRRYRPN